MSSQPKRARVLMLQGKCKYNMPSQPSLTIQGRWLREAGFKVTDRVSVTITGPGMLEIALYPFPVQLTHSNECATICAE